MRQVRIGIDVGGTFTDAVAIDSATYEIIAQEKIPTTHDAKEGVAEGIVKVLQNILQKNGIAPEEVVFIAHGTTQATNALLEGDVACTGILAMGSGLEAGRAKTVSNIGNIPLALGKELKTVYAFVETADAKADEQEIADKIKELKAAGAEVIVATEAYSVDDPANESFVVKLARDMGLYATVDHEVSKLYGLKVRTRTAVVNGSLIPRMMETANMTEACVKRSGIPASLMIMRCDGGVMTVDEVRRRPILTMLSGLAAGVAGVLMYEKLSDGIFLEAGGTSTDISVVKDGRVMVRYGEIGGHKTYLSSLDVRTLGVAGGSGGVVVPYLGKKMNVHWKIVKKAPIISTIGVAMAMVREVVERTVTNPTEGDMKAIRHEALEQFMKSGAAEATVEITIEYDKKTNILRATATGATELKMGDVAAKELSDAEIRQVALNSLRLPDQDVTEVAAAGKWHVFDGRICKRFLGLFTSEKHLVRVIDRNGVVTLQREGVGVIVTNKVKLKTDLGTLFEETATYGTVGEELPMLFAYYGEKQLDLSGLTAREQMLSVLEAELDVLSAEEPVILLAAR